MNNAGIHVFFSRFDFAPDGFVRHVHQFGSLIHRAGPLNVFQNPGPAFSNNDVIVFIDDPLA
jgi:hypothetical protein